MELPANYRPLTLTSGIHVSAARTPNKIALKEGVRELSFGALAVHITAVASRLIEMGLQPGDRVAVLAPNCLEYPELVCGIADAGLIAVTLNPRSHPAEMAGILADSRARVIFVHPAFDEMSLGLAAPLVERFIRLNREYTAWRDAPRATVALPPISEFDSCILVYTSGTTGGAKGVLLPHRARTLLFFAKSVEYGCYGPEDRFLGIAPMALGAGFGFGMCAVFFGGYLDILPNFDPERVLAKLATDEITGLFVVPSHLHAVFALPPAVLERYRGRASRLKTIISNAAALPYAVKQQVVDYWGHGILHETYGFTEAGIVTNLPPAHQLSKPGSVGGAFPLCDLRLLDDAGADVSRGDIGELYVSSPYLFNGYYERPDETASCMRGRWISAGDLARQDDDGCYYIVDRKKDMVVSGGLNVYPREIEEILIRHPAVAECAVIGLPDDRWGERLLACLVLKPGCRVDTEEIIAFCRGSLSDYKIPRALRILTDLPRNANGKVLKRLLKDAPAATAVQP
jgi:long-chain acyl-CoA synthetase